MAKLDLNDINQVYFDVLCEIGNIGTGNATTALAQMLDCRVDMYVPQVRLLEFSEVGTIMGGEEQLMAGIYLAVEGDIDGSILFLLEIESAHFLLEKIFKTPKTGNELTDMESSALMEIGNIITGAYLNALSTMTGLRIEPSVPDLTIDMAGAILSVPAIEFSKISDKALLIETEFGDKDTIINGYFILIPTLDAFATIFSALGLS